MKVNGYRDCLATIALLSVACCLRVQLKLHCKNDPYFYGKSLLNLRVRHMETALQQTFLAANFKCPCDRYLTCLWHGYRKYRFPWTTSLIYRLTDRGSVCYKYVTNMSKSDIIMCSQPFCIFFIKIQLFFSVIEASMQLYCNLMSGVWHPMR